jgi:hypothetical protein
MKCMKCVAKQNSTRSEWCKLAKQALDTAVLIKALKLTRRNVTVCVADIWTFKEQNGRRREDVVSGRRSIRHEAACGF